MASYYTNEYVKLSGIPSFAVKGRTARIEKAGNFEDYTKRHGKKALSMVGYHPNALILELEYHDITLGKPVITFDNQDAVKKILKDFRAKKPANLEGKIALGLMQFEKTVGIGKAE